MINRTLIIATLTLALLVAACSTQTANQYPVPPVQPTPIQSVPPPVQSANQTPPAEPAQPAATVVNDTTALFTGTINKTQIVSDIRCDVVKRTLTFTITNRGQKTWQLYGALSFPAPQDMSQAKVFINNYQANGLQPYYGSDRQRLFGPSERFSENCGVVDRLAPDASATCSLTAVPLYASSNPQYKNHIWVVSDLGSSETVTFTC